MQDRQRILVMRHPQTKANVEGTLSGRKDVDLTALGEEQMFRAQEALVSWAPERIWCSPLSRCKAIAEEAASRLGIACVVEPLLAEIEFGSAQGMTVAQLREQGYSFPWSLDAHGRSIAPPEAESFEELRMRAAQLLDKLRPLFGRTACITHGGFTRALVGEALQIPLESFWNLWLPNVSSQVLCCDGSSFSLAALALAPEEVIRRTEEPWLIGQDTTKNIAGSDDK